MKIKQQLSILFFCAVFLFSCTKNEERPPMALLATTDSNITVAVTKSFTFATSAAGGHSYSNEWLLDGKVVGTENVYVFKPSTAGIFTLVYKATNTAGSYSYTYHITVPTPVVDVTPASSKYISQVFEYAPAPGQFINEATLGSPAQAQKLVGGITNMVSLGGFGGYVVFGFDHSVKNQDGHDLAIYGNPAGAPYHFSEPGIVMVSQDKNGNGLPDDEWYELAGSEYSKATTLKNYEITYTNPKAFANVPWTDNQGNSGVLLVNNFHRHNFYPEFAANQEKITLKGTLLPSSIGKNGGISISSPFAWGYTDSYSDGDDYKTKLYNSFDISWAVDKNGQKVSLNTVDFVRVHTAQNADGGSLGEISTEIKGAADLNIK